MRGVSALHSFLSFLCGIWLGLLHAPFSIGFFALPSLPLAYLVARRSQNLWRSGYLFGFGYFFTVMHWIYEPFLVRGGDFTWMGIPAWLLMSLGLALFWLPLFRFANTGTWAVALTFGIVEFLRANIFTGFPWALISYGFIDTWLAPSSAYIGAFALSTLIVFSALSLADLPKLKAPILGAIILGLVLLPYLSSRTPDEHKHADFKVTGVQGNVPQSEYMDINNANLIMETYLSLSKGSADLVIWPEAAIMSDPTQTPFIATYMNLELEGQPLLTGGLHWTVEINRETNLPQNKFYNAAYMINSEGDVTHKYLKTHLVPFGEYIPFSDLLMKFNIATETLTMFSASAGTYEPWQAEGMPKINILICYEGIFPKYARREGDFIVVITNDGWFGEIGGPSQHLVAAQFRAIESGKPVVRVARTGISALIDADGQITERIELNQQGSFTSKVGPRYTSTLYARTGDWPYNLILFIGAVALIVRVRKSTY